MDNGRILVMDDEKDIRDILSKMLNHLHYEVEVASNGSEAIALFKNAIAINKPFNSVIMDLKVANGMSGEDAISVLLGLYPGTKIILCTGSVGDQIIADYRTYGICAIIRKPFKINDLSNALQKVNL